MSRLYLRDDTMIQNAYRYGTDEELTPEIYIAAETYNIRRLQEDQNVSLVQSHEVLTQGLIDIKERIQEDTYDQNRIFKQGFNQVESGFYALSDSLQSGFETFQQNMQQGFVGVTQAICASHHELGGRMMQGFQGVSQHLAQQTAVMDSGFQAVVANMQAGLREQLAQTAYEGQATRQAIGQAAVALAQHFSKESEVSRDLTLRCHQELVNVVVQGFTSQMQLMAQQSLVQEQALRQISNQLNQVTDILKDIRQVLVHQQRFQANEDFLVGMQYLKHLRLQNAEQQFEKALAKFGGHYQSLLAMGYLQQQFYEDLDAAYDWFHRAYAQAGQDPTHSAEERRAERSFAAMYLARILFTRQNYQAALALYKEAYVHSGQKLFSALIEAAVCLFFLHSSAEAGKKVREDFGHSAVRWYALALELSPYFAEYALDSLRMALACDGRVKQLRRASWVWGILQQLNPRYVRVLRNLIKKESELAWLLSDK